MDGGVGGTPRASCVVGFSSLDELSDGRDDVVHAARVRRGKVFAQKRASAARPEQKTDPEADGEADRHVLDANHPHPPADGLDEVEEHEEDNGEACLARGERDRARRVGGEQDRDRQHAPQHGFVCADAEHE